ncbi:MAG: hypothetical protein ABIO02_00130 [Patescibacteria group bacterium]
MKLLRLFKKYFEPFFLSINKRVRFVFSVLAIGATLLLSSFFYFDTFFIFLPILILGAYFCTYFSILEGIEKKEWIMLFIMPVVLTVSFYLFYFLFFPVRWITRIPFLLIYSFSLYAILLTSNIFNVGVERSLQLYRAAFAINYFFHTVVLFLLFSILFLFKQIFFINAFAAFLIVFPLALQLLWSVKPKVSIDKKVVDYSLFTALCIAELAMIVSFVPLQAPIMALLLTACYYCISGLIYHYIDEKLYTPTIREYLVVIIIVTMIALLTIKW